MNVIFFGEEQKYFHADFRAKLRGIIWDLMKEGVYEYRFRGKGMFENLAAIEVMMLKHEAAYCRSVLVIPYPDRERDELLYDETLYPPIGHISTSHRSAARDDWMLREADIVVCHAKDTAGKSYAKMQRAIKLGKKVINLADFI